MQTSSLTMRLLRWLSMLVPSDTTPTSQTKKAKESKNCHKAPIQAVSAQILSPSSVCTTQADPCAKSATEPAAGVELSKVPIQMEKHSTTRPMLGLCSHC